MYEKIKQWIYSKIGYPKEIQNLLNYLRQLEGKIIVYPADQFKLNIITSENILDDPIIFNTQHECIAFQSGLALGVHMMGGSIEFMPEEVMEEFIEQKVKITTNLNPKKLH